MTCTTCHDAHLPSRRQPREELVAACIQCHADPHARVRLCAAMAVWGIARDLETARIELWRGLTSDIPRVRAMAAEAFGELGDAGVDLLIIALLDRDPAVRAAAATTLGRVGGGNDLTRQALGEAAQDSDLDVAVAAKRALAALSS